MEITTVWPIVICVLIVCSSYKIYKLWSIIIGFRQSLELVGFHNIFMKINDFYDEYRKPKVDCQINIWRVSLQVCDYK